jgi:hypothetical protein
VTRSRTLAVAGLALAAACGATAYRWWCEPWSRRWGASDAELEARLPIDDLVAADASATTRAITIRAGITDVWLWLVQIGQDRAGFYSHT